jgi:hypothetical protein
MNAPFGSVSVTEPNHGGPSVCAIKVILAEDGLFGAIDLGPDEARAIALQLLSRTGAVMLGDISRETLHGARH